VTPRVFGLRGVEWGRGRRDTGASRVPTRRHQARFVCVGVRGRRSCGGRFAARARVCGEALERRERAAAASTHSAAAVVPVRLSRAGVCAGARRAALRRCLTSCSRRSPVLARPLPAPLTPFSRPSHPPLTPAASPAGPERLGKPRPARRAPPIHRRLTRGGACQQAAQAALTHGFTELQVVAVPAAGDGGPVGAAAAASATSQEQALSMMLERLEEIQLQWRNLDGGTTSLLSQAHVLGSSPLISAHLGSSRARRMSWGRSSLAATR